MDDEITDSYYYWYSGGSAVLQDGSVVFIYAVLPDNDPPFNKKKSYGYIRLYRSDGKSNNWKASTVSELQYSFVQVSSCSFVFVF
jgi:hypothetical protein